MFLTPHTREQTCITDMSVARGEGAVVVRPFSLGTQLKTASPAGPRSSSVTGLSSCIFQGLSAPLALEPASTGGIGRIIALPPKLLTLRPRTVSRG